IYEIDRCIDDKGLIKSNASKDLFEIIQHIQSEEQGVRKKIQSIAKKIIENGWGPENSVTIRNDRLVLSVFAEHKRKVAGLVHDESATGQTFYIEPTEIFELNNYIRELHIEKQREIRKILIELTNKLRPVFPVFDLISQKMGIIDFIKAKALVSGKMNASVPQIDDKVAINWMQARHPLLYLNHKKSNRKVIPFDIQLTRDKRIIVVSGPNAGGKSVLLKAVGLLQMMVQHGIPVPASPDSKVGLYKQIFVDIGDQQSIDNDLSTYSSHLANMKHFIQFSTSKTLFLIDEMGTGTDPLFGGPMAEAILEQMNKKFSYGVVTTHYSNLKMFANHTNGLGNGSMVFDNDALQPLYMFDDGKPGSSYTFEIAAKTGLDKEIIAQAKKKAGNKLNQTDSLLIELEREKTYIKNLKEDLEKTKAKADQLKLEYETIKNEIESKRNILIKESKTEALKVLTEAKKVVENTVREIKENLASNPKKSREPLEEMLSQLESDIKKEEKPVVKKQKNVSIAVGEWVKVISTGREGEVLSISKDKVELSLGDIKRKVALDDVEKVPVTKQKTVKKMNSSIDINTRMASFNAEINIIGLRGDEAIAEVLKFIDEAIMLGHDKIRIVHGRGAGILKKIVRNELKKISSVTSYTNEVEEFGGDAITVVKLL
ncbi:MAG: Smr/MutS family protein, partial [Bacteroidetes bacterium]|nr:Smr/MutS family protein [Bacteroidota bacterium]